MALTLYARFADASLAERAAGALIDHGVHNEDLSIIAHDSYGAARAVAAPLPGAVPVDSPTPYTIPTAVPVETVVPVNSTVPVEGTVPAATVPAVRPVDTMGGVPVTDVAVDPTTPEETASAPRLLSGGPAVRVDPIPPPTAPAAVHDVEFAAKGGLTTTTPADAGVGAAKGAGIGLGLGIVGGLISLLVPGVGLVLGGGAIAAAVAAAAATTAAGAVAGGVAGYLKDQGVPEEVATDYQSAIDHGGAILAVQVPSGPVDVASAERVVAKYNATNVQLLQSAA